MKRLALCIHDLRVSDGEKVIETIKNIREYFKIGMITVHLVIDNEINREDKIFQYLKEEAEHKQLEIVFHGISHQCPDNTGKLLSWYHKNQAEFLSNTFQADLNRLRYNKLNELLPIKAGICPPCWIANSAGWKFIKSLSPLYFEKLLSINFNNNHYFSLPLSLASNNKNELYFLKRLAALISSTAILCSHSRLRFILHTIDLTNNDSLAFFQRKYSNLISNGYIPVLQRELAP